MSILKFIKMDGGQMTKLLSQNINELHVSVYLTLLGKRKNRGQIKVERCCVVLH